MALSMLFSFRNPRFQLVHFDLEVSCGYVHVCIVVGYIFWNGLLNLVSTACDSHQLITCYRARGCTGVE